MSRKLVALATQDCANECRIEIEGQKRTLIAFTPQFDKQGRQINQDPNTTTYTLRCLTCAKLTRIVAQAGVTPLVEDIT